jgi:[protein-PII] uridylyltransferase
LDLASALKEKMQYRRSLMPFSAPKPPQVLIDNESSSFFTVIDVYTYDSPGLLFRITDALFKCELDIWIAKIATKVDQVVDVFYVRDYDGQKVDAPDQVRILEESVLEVLRESDPLSAIPL